jgi:hypothetical protein
MRFCREGHYGRSYFEGFYQILRQAIGFTFHLTTNFAHDLFCISCNFSIWFSTLVIFASVKDQGEVEV